MCAKVLARARAAPVCEALGLALARHGVPEQMFDGVCVENGIGYLLTAPRSSATTGRRGDLLMAARRRLIHH